MGGRRDTQFKNDFMLRIEWHWRETKQTGQLLGEIY
jgi:hypothetical protein